MQTTTPFRYEPGLVKIVSCEVRFPVQVNNNNVIIDRLIDLVVSMSDN